MVKRCVAFSVELMESCKYASFYEAKYAESCKINWDACPFLCIKAIRPRRWWR